MNYTPSKIIFVCVFIFICIFALYNFSISSLEEDQSTRTIWTDTQVIIEGRNIKMVFYREYLDNDPNAEDYIRLAKIYTLYLDNAYDLLAIAFGDTPYGKPIVFEHNPTWTASYAGNPIRMCYYPPLPTSPGLGELYGIGGWFHELAHDFTVDWWGTGFQEPFAPARLSGRSESLPDSLL